MGWPGDDCRKVGAVGVAWGVDDGDGETVGGQPFGGEGDDGRLARSIVDQARVPAVDRDEVGKERNRRVAEIIHPRSVRGVGLTARVLTDSDTGMKRQHRPVWLGRAGRVARIRPETG